MGIYFIIANDTKKQYVNPASHGESQKIDLDGMAQNTSRTVTYLLRFDWAGDSIRLVADGPEEYDNIVSSWTEVMVDEDHEVVVVPKAPKGYHVLDRKITDLESRMRGMEGH